jgi:hypothetical protein
MTVFRKKVGQEKHLQGEYVILHFYLHNYYQPEIGIHFTF